MFERKKSSGIDQAAAQLEAEFGIPFAKTPDKASILERFDTMTRGLALSHEAKVPLLYRLVIMNFLAACKIMRDRGHDTNANDLLWLTNISDSSVSWSERAKDHIILEQITSQLNANIVRFLSSFRVHAGGTR